MKPSSISWELKHSANEYLVNYSTPTKRNGSVDWAILSFIVASITFFLGHTVVQANLSVRTSEVSPSGNQYSVLPGEGTLWKKGFEQH